MRDFLTTSSQNFWREVIEKEKHTKIAWREMYAKKDYRNIVMEKKEQPKLHSKTIKLPTINTHKPQNVKSHQNIIHVNVDIQRQSTMRPISPSTLSLLYIGTSKDGKGRASYLKKRAQLGPEERYHFPKVSSWQYGWRLGDMVKSYKPPEHGRTTIIKDHFYRKNGVLVKPSYTDWLL